MIFLLDIKSLDVNEFLKRNRSNGTINKFKIRLVAKGFTQRRCINYFDTYSPITRKITIHVLITLAMIYKFQVHQMDIEITFLNSDLKEEIYIDQP